MASGRHDRASMREGPLADLFRKTEEDKPREEPKPEPRREPDPPAAREPEHREVQRYERPEPSPRPGRAPETPAARREPEAAPSPSRYEGVPSPQERLKSVFSSDIPENIMEKPATPPSRAPA